jgi:uncharacterized membrane protein
MITITVYGYPDSESTSVILQAIEEQKGDIPVKTILVNLTDDAQMAEFIGDKAPMVQVGPYRLKSPIHPRDLKVAITAANDRAERLKDDPAYNERINRGRTITKSDKFNLWFSKNYVWAFVLVLTIYVGLALIAPVFMKIGWEVPAKTLYVFYKPFCHQLAFRSFFFFGEQAYYPRELAGIEGLITYDDLIREGLLDEEADLLDARNFLGNEEVGYKTALCQRCLAIYASMGLFAVIYALSGNKIKPPAWYLWILIGIVPIGLDGGSQIPGLLGITLPEWMIMRESTPVFRVITGTLFGLMTFWYLLPQVEDSMRNTRMNLVKKFAYQNEVNKEDAK